MEKDPVTPSAEATVPKRGGAMRVAVDLTPILPGGGNGGAKPMTISLLNALAGRGVLIFGFCRPESLDELCIGLATTIRLAPVHGGDIQTAFRVLDTDVDVALFPFGSVSFGPVSLPKVAVIHDLQFLAMPDNFPAHVRVEREQNLRSCLAGCDRIITISNFSKDEIIGRTGYDAALIDVAPIIFEEKTPHISSIRKTLAGFGLKRQGYIIYPANFWEHKNHRTLLAAYLLYRRSTRQPAKLVLTGDVGSAVGQEIVELAAALAPDHIVVPGYVDPATLHLLLDQARGVVYPSLYEGFGIPLVEAMQKGVPVAASWTTSLAEVAGGAALLFDPHQPRAIADAMSRLVDDEPLRRTLVETGRRRLIQFGSKERTTDIYMQALDKAAEFPRERSHDVEGVTPDGWMESRAAVVVSASAASARTIRIVLGPPSYLPHPVVPLRVGAIGLPATTVILRRGQRYLLEHDVPPSGDRLEFNAGRLFVPADFMPDNGDMRNLALRIFTIELVEGTQVTRLSWSGHEVVEDYAPGRPTRVLFRHDGPTPRTASGVIDADTSVLTGSAGFTGNSKEPPITVIEQLENDHRIIVLPSRPIADPVSFSPGSTGEAVGRFSVVTPSFRQGEFIARTIESVLQQERIADYTIFDAGSDDATTDEVKPYLNRLTFVQEPDFGQADAINKAMDHGRGEYIAWINSDDTFAPGAFKAVAAAFDTDPTLDVIYGDGYHIDREDFVINRYGTEDFRLSRLFETCFICQPATFFRRRVIERHGGLRVDLRYCMDYEFWLRLGVRGAKFRRLDRHLANSRFYDDTKTLGSRVPVHIEINEMMRSCFGVRVDKWVDAVAHLVLEKELTDLKRQRRDLAFKQIRALAASFWQPDPDRLVDASAVSSSIGSVS